MTDAERFWRHVDRGKDCWNWIGAMDHTGYGRVGRQNRGHQAHRWAWRLTYGEIPAGLNVCHHCDNKRCVNPSHLFLGTQKENMQDAKRKGLMRRCGWPPNSRAHAKLTAEQVAVIRLAATKNACGNWHRIALARQYGLSRSAIGRILKFHSWKPEGGQR